MNAYALAAILAVAQALPTPSALDDDQIREFLCRAPIVSVTSLSKGTTRPKRVTLSDGTLTHDAVFNVVDEAKAIQRFQGGRVEIDFRDSWQFNIAAGEVARLVGLGHMVPLAVERIINGQRGSLVWWVEWEWDEQMRVQQKLAPPDPAEWARQWDTARVFRELIADTDRNQTNMLITKDWQLKMVDFTRAFRRSKKVRTPKALVRCPRVLLERLRTLNEDEVRAAVGRYLDRSEVAALVARSRHLVEHFDALVAERGAELVLF
ncbi:MAG TPA: hypothetical protein VF198_07535 [Vicinamibacterales bacterium]